MRGLQVLEAAFNEDANMSEYAARFKPNHPVGKINRDMMATYIQYSPMMRISVPVLLFIDRNGLVQFQTHGGEPFFQPESELKNRIREIALKLVASGASSGGASRSRKK